MGESRESRDLGRMTRGALGATAELAIHHSFLLAVGELSFAESWVSGANKVAAPNFGSGGVVGDRLVSIAPFVGEHGVTNTAPSNT